MQIVPLNTTGPLVGTPKKWTTLLQTLQQGIISGRYRSRERLIEDEIIDSTGATRHAVRRAFSELESLGLIVRFANRGVQVRDFTAKEFSDLFDLRECLELKAVESYDSPADSAFVLELDRIEMLHQTAVRANNVAEMYVYDSLFHQTLYSRCSNAMVSALIHSVSLQSSLVNSSVIHSEQIRLGGLAQHRQMIDAIARGDKADLENAIVSHLSTFRDYFSSIFHDHDHPLLLRRTSD